MTRKGALEFLLQYLHISHFPEQILNICTLATPLNRYPFLLSTNLKKSLVQVVKLLG
ncbi:hypothetical protein [Wolbachia endosymbiont (group A) of Agelastica alni]|uniref:hypothetical protein n=1 Tax=Wolbachia endosymbiont (group A) of Agelastica alni TaxID=3066130 RepID=UPI00313336E5